MNSEAIRSGSYRIRSYRGRNRVQKEIDLFIRRERSHDADAENLPAELSDARSHIDAIVLQQARPQLSFIYSGWHARRNQVPNAVLWNRNKRLKSKLAQTLDEPVVCSAMPFPSVVEPLLLDYRKAFTLQFINKKVEMKP